MSAQDPEKEPSAAQDMARQDMVRQDMARRWQALAERRRAHLLELYRSGRWRAYYTEEQITARMRDAVRGIGDWSLLSGEPPVADNDVPPLREAAE